MTMATGVALMFVAATVAGWNGRPSLIAPGGDPARGLLVNLTPGARPFDPPDRSRPTVVFVHGFNPLPRAVHFRMAEQFADAIARRGGPALNVLGWDWNAATFASLHPGVNNEAAIAQGRALAFALKGTGVGLSQTHLIGHSAGGIVAASAARCLASEWGEPVAQLTLLDPAAYYHATIFNRLAAGTAAPLVENYWGTGPSGYGQAVAAAGVWNVQVAGPYPYFGVIWPLRSNHLFIVMWYIDTAAAPAFPSGFGTSVLLRPGASGPQRAATEAAPGRRVHSGGANSPRASSISRTAVRPRRASRAPR
jgi:pimeloyl-ACP methyl ester carboxylesterase